MLTWMIFFGAGYFGAVWTHYFSGETPAAHNSEVSVKVLPLQNSCPQGKQC